MASRKLGFEALYHRLNDEQYLVPLRLDENRNPSHLLTVPLLKAAELIAPQLTEETSDRRKGKLVLSELVDEVGELLTAEPGSFDEDEPTQLLIEGEHGSGAINMTSSQSRILMRGQYQAKIPTQELFNMLYAWDVLRAEHSEG